MKAFAGLSSDDDDSDEDMAPALPIPGRASPLVDEDVDDDEARAELRFRAELEFLQCLAAPRYCQFFGCRYKAHGSPNIVVSMPKKGLKNFFFTKKSESLSTV